MFNKNIIVNREENIVVEKNSIVSTFPLPLSTSIIISTKYRRIFIKRKINSFMTEVPII